MPHASSPPSTSSWDTVPLIEAPFDQYQRYRIVAELAEACPTAHSPLRVLDVGGHHEDFYGSPHRPIAEALPSARTITVDLAGNPLGGYVRGRGDQLPFINDAFDVACAVDVLEHVPRPARQQVLHEIGRVASQAIVVAAPFENARLERAEALLARFVEDTLGAVQTQLREHRELGWPSLAETVGRMEAAGWIVLVFPYGNLWRWLQMMVDKHALAALPGSRPTHIALDAAYNRRHFEDDRQRPCYRHFLVAARIVDHPVLDRARRRFGAVTLGDLGPDAETADTTELLFSLAEIHAANQQRIARAEPSRRDEHVRELVAHSANLYRGHEALRNYIAKLEAQFREVEGSLSFRVGRLLRRLLPRR